MPEEINNCKKATKDVLLSLIEKQVKVDIECDVYVKLLSGFERRLFHQLMTADKTLDVNEAPVTMVPTLIALCAVDGCGKNIFGTEKADIEEIDKQLPSIVQNKIFGAAAKLNGLTSDAVDESVKN